MAKTRLDLQNILENILGRREDNKQNVYFSPPTGYKLVYDCIIYKRSKPWVTHADDRRYLGRECYSITLITTNPDTRIPEKILALPMCTKEREFMSDELYHTVFTLYF